MQRSNMPRLALPGEAADTRAWWLAALVALLAGALWGALCWIGDGFPDPYSAFFNLGTPWLLLAWLVGRWAGGNPRGAACGGLALAAAVAAYYAGYTSGISVVGLESRVYTVTARNWLVLAALAGPVFGAAGAWSRDSGAWMRIAGVTLVAGTLLGEVGYYLPGLFVRESSPFFDPTVPRLLTVAGYVLPRNGGVFVLAVQTIVAVALVPAVLRSRRELALGLGALAALAGAGVLALEFIYQLIRGY